MRRVSQSLLAIAACTSAALVIVGLATARGVQVSHAADLVPYKTHSFVVKTSNGYRIRVKLAAFGPYHVGKVPRWWNGPNVPPCSANRYTDALVVVTAQTRNLTSFPVKVQYSLSVQRAAAGLNGLLVTANTLGCTAIDPSLFSEPYSMNPGQWGEADARIVIKGYYSPAHPRGNRALLTGTCVIAGFTYINGYLGGLSAGSGCVF